MMERCFYCGMTYHPMPVYTSQIDYDIERLDQLVNEYFAYNESWPNIVGQGIEGIAARLQEQWPPDMPSPFKAKSVREVAAMILHRGRRHVAGMAGRLLPSRIHVCHVKLVKTGDGLTDWDVVRHDECHKRAEMDGYELRMDLTPKR